MFTKKSKTKIASSQCESLQAQWSDKANKHKLPGLKHLLAVAGPAGSGKSTLLKQLASNGLTEEIAGLLPLGADNWAQLGSGSKYGQWLSVIVEASNCHEIPGIILHYELTRNAILGVEFQNDPVLQLFKMAKRSTVINIRTPSDRLVSQLVFKKTGIKTKRELRRTIRFWTLVLKLRFSLSSIASILPRNWLTRIKKVRRVSQVWKNLVAPRTEGMVFRVNRYEQKGWLDELWARWRNHLDHLSAEGVVIDVIDVEPLPITHAGQTAGWRLVSKRDQ